MFRCLRCAFMKKKAFLCKLLVHLPLLDNIGDNDLPISHPIWAPDCLFRTFSQGLNFFFLGAKTPPPPYPRSGVCVLPPPWSSSNFLIAHITCPYLVRQGRASGHAPTWSACIMCNQGPVSVNFSPREMSQPYWEVVLAWLVNVHSCEEHAWVWCWRG